MRSAYGRQTPPPDYELTCVEPGSPMGELLRRYWQPVCTSDELLDLPKKVKLLCEELVVFRDKKGRLGALEPHCSHRGTSLEWGRVEEAGLRCCYHGWLYDTQGQCIDMPCETEEFRERRGCPISCVSSSRDALYVVGGSRTWHERSGTR